jgi:4-amino-4-deoxy-L-arabinose transferase-like glycosyltransferase
LLFALPGFVLLFLAAVANYSGEFLLAAHWRIFLRLPGMPGYQYWFFPIWYVIIGLPLALVALSLVFPAFRRALRQPWRSSSIAVPLVATLIFLAFSLFPWEPANLKPEDLGSHMVFYVVVAGCGFALFMAGTYRLLRFLDEPLRRIYDRLMDLPRWQFLLLCAGFTFIVANLVSLFVFEHLPHIQDSIAQVFQARIFASGRLYLPSSAFPDFFDYTHIINISGQTGHPASGFNIPNWPGPAGRWYSQYPFLHSFLLMLGVLVHMPWVINPLLGALTIPAIYFLARELYDESTARLSAGLASLTPFIFNMSAEYMNHASALLFVTLFALFYFRTLNPPAPSHKPQATNAHRSSFIRHSSFIIHHSSLTSLVNPLLAGAFLGLVANVRSFSALGLAVPFACYGLYLVVREPGRYLPRFLVMVVAAGTVTGLILVYNWLTNGHPLLFGYVVKWGAGHEIGFGRSGWGDQHTPLRGLVNTGHDANLLNKFLFEWPLPALVPLGILFASGTRDRRDWLLVSMYFALAGAYFFYWFHNVCFGPRFLYESSAALVILTVRGGKALPTLLRNTFNTPVDDRAVARFLGRSLAVLLFVMVAAGLWPLFKSYRSYGWVNDKYLRNVKRHELHNALVFCAQYGAGFTANPLSLQADVIYARDYGMLNSALTVAYPGRACYYVSQDTLRLLEDMEYPESRLKRALDEMSSSLNDSTLANFRTLLWPFRDLSPSGLDPALLSDRFADFREVSRELFTGRHRLEDYMPMLACWMLKDSREHLQIFTYMDDLESFVAGEYKFTLLYVTSDGTAAIYDIRPTSGTETVVPDKSGALPIR